MKNAIIQYYLNFNGIGKDILKEHFPAEVPEWAIVSSESFKSYSKKYDADYYFYSDKFVNSKSNFFEALRVYKDPDLDQYDNVLYADCDVLVKNYEKNIFDIKYTDIAGVPEYKHDAYCVPVNWGNSAPLEQRFKDFGSRLVKPMTINAPIRMINSGIILWSKQARLKARNQFDDHEKWFHHKNALLDSTLKNVGHSSHCLDQPYLNAMWTKYNFEVHELSMEWNRFPTHDENYPCIFAHYVQNYRFNMPKIFKEQVK